MDDATEKKFHYQNVKAMTLLAASILHGAALDQAEGVRETEVVATAKRFYNEITGQDWSGPDVPGA